MDDNDTIWWVSTCGNRTIYDALWSYSLSINTSTPDLTYCFQGTILSWIPCFYILLFSSLIYLPVICKRRRTINNLSRLYYSKTVIICLLLVIGITRLIYDLTLHTPIVYLVTNCLELLSLCLCLIINYSEFRRGLHSEGTLFVFWLMEAVVKVIRTRSSYLDGYSTPATKSLSTLDAIVTCVSLLLSIPSDLGALNYISRAKHERKPLLSKTKEEEDNDEILSNKPCPEIYANYLSRTFYLWIISIVVKAFKRTINFEDLNDILPTDKCRILVRNFNKQWEKQLKKHKFDFGKKLQTKRKKLKSSSYTFESPNDTGILESEENEPFFSTPKRKEEKKKDKPSAAWAMCLTFGPYFLLGGFYKIIYDLISFVCPVLLNLLIDFVKSNGVYSWQGYVMVVVLFVVTTIKSLIMQHYYHVCFKTGMFLKSAVTGIVYRKSLKMNNAARQESTVGEIVNLMSVDAQKLQDGPAYFHMLWSSPFTVIIAVVYLYRILGVAVFAGLLVMVLMVPFNMLMARMVMKYYIAQMGIKDIRIKHMSEILNGMKVLKLYAWEQAFEDRADSSRTKEIAKLRQAEYLQAFGSISWNMSSYLVALATFAVYVKISPDNILDANKAFVSLSLFNILKYPMSILQPCIQFFVQAMVAMSRLRKYLLLPELDEDNVTFDKHASHAISIRDGKFSWTKNDPPILSDISINVSRSKLVAVVGQVGSGKSSLLSAMLGEMEVLEGSVRLNSERMAYVPQQAWIQHNTIEKNITFGKAMETGKYNQILDACALRPDLQILSGGDQTEVGEKGINLSGGQKQRISLARAVYQNADIYFFDDPLSAVDAHVGKHLFENVVGPTGLLSNKTRILVTNAITFLPEVDEIYVLNNGRISEQGTYQQLVDNKKAFADFLNQHTSIISNETTVKKSQPAILNRTISSYGGQSFSESSMYGYSDSFTESAKSERTRYKGKLTEEESAEVGKVKWSVYTNYIKAGGVISFIVLMGFHLCFLAMEVGSNVWLSKWTEDSDRSTSFTDYRLGIYGTFGSLQLVSVLIRSVVLALFITTASANLHSDMLKRIFRAPMAFFDTTPLGRIMNRFSKDIDTIDVNIPLTFRILINVLVPVLSTLIVISMTTPYFLIILVPVVGVYYFLQVIFISSARQLKRLESISRSPIFTHFSETLSGSMSIRAYRKEGSFIKKSDKLTDENQMSYYPRIVADRWISMSLETLGNIVVFFSALFAVIQRDKITGGDAGLSVAYALQATVALNLVVRMTSDLETYIVAVERVREYSTIESEARRYIPGFDPPSSWPEKGIVEFKNYSTRYRSDLDLVLRDVNLKLKSCEKVGVVGRTGAGKSSLTLALFRIIESVSGKVIVDKRDLSSMGLQSVRSRLTIIPQDPVLFSGTLRFNLDPHMNYSDDKLLKSLEQAHLSPFVNNLPGKLDHECSEGGSNLSVGQRQLVCLARALLRHTKVLILDEATAAIDLETDELIQNTIRSEFSDCTVITIAHRLNTILDYDKVIVLDSGQIIEENSPDKLLLDKQSIFYSMASNAGLV